MTLPPGRIVGERYQIEALLGKGGFGAVYLVRDLRVRQNVFALKEIVNPSGRERRHFTFEGEVLKRTDHPSLPRVYRSFDDPAQGRAYILMDYIEGSNLEQLRRQQPEQHFTLSQTLLFIKPIIEAVAYLHAQQPPIMHRDIKPANIISSDSSERTVLVDFGIAKEVDQEGTTTAVRHATPSYAAPEQYGTGTDIRTDIYGLGATLYTLLTGTPPVDAFFRMTQQMNQQPDPLMPVEHLVPDLPHYVSAAISRAMALDKDERFATVEDFWHALNPDPGAIEMEGAVLASPLVKIRPLQQINRQPAPAPFRRRGRSIVVALLLLLALGIGFATALFLVPKLRNQPASLSTRTPGITQTHVATAALTPSPRPTQKATSQPTTPPTEQPTAAPTPSIPALASTYTGSIHDNNGDINTSMTLNGIIQHGKTIQGTFHVDPPLSGNGPFTGTVQADSSLQFTVHSSDPDAERPLFFFGQIQQNGTISGQYCSLDATGSCNHAVGGYGTWSVQPANLGS